MALKMSYANKASERSDVWTLVIKAAESPQPTRSPAHSERHSAYTRAQPFTERLNVQTFERFDIVTLNGRPSADGPLRP